MHEKTQQYLNELRAKEEAEKRKQRDVQRLSEQQAHEAAVKRRGEEAYRYIETTYGPAIEEGYAKLRRDSDLLNIFRRFEREKMMVYDEVLRKKSFSGTSTPYTQPFQLRSVDAHIYSSYIIGEYHDVTTGGIREKRKEEGSVTTYQMGETRVDGTGKYYTYYYTSARERHKYIFGNRLEVAYQISNEYTGGYIRLEDDYGPQYFDYNSGFQNLEGSISLAINRSFLRKDNIYSAITISKEELEPSRVTKPDFWDNFFEW